jgi:flagellar basal-body rod modification protein FlgD
MDLTDYQKTLAAKASSTTTTTSTSSGSSTLDKNSFMQLMVTQLRYQDPLNPSDNQQMAAQMAQFSQLEALQNMQTSLTDLEKTISTASDKQTSAAQASATATATSLIGQVARLKRTSVDYSGSDVSLQVKASAGSEVAILDAKGNVVRTIPLDGTGTDGKSILDSNGEGSVTWDGKGDDGKTVSTGSYSIQVRDSASGSETGYSYEQSTITGVGSGTNGTVLQTANGSYDLADLMQVDTSSSSSTESSTAGSAAAAIALIGHQVRVRDASGVLSSTSGGTDWTFSAQSGAKGRILDAQGNVVRTFDVSGTDDSGSTIMGSDGTGSFHWSGVGSSGSTASNGTYYLQIVSADGTSSAGTAYQSVKVDEVGFDSSGNPILMSGTTAWPFKNLYTAS